MAKRKYSKKRNSKKTGRPNAGGIITTILVVVLVLILLIPQGTDFGGSVSEIFDTFINVITGNTNANAKALINLEENADKLTLYVIDTGNSDSMLLRAPTGETLLVDAADDDDYRHIRNVLSAFETETLTAALATHPDADHIGSMDDVIKKYTPQTFYLTDVKKDTRNYKNMMDALGKNNIAVIEATAGLEFYLGDVRVTVLNPFEKEYESANESSIVLRIEYGSTAFLLTGDIEKQAIADLLAAYPELLDVDVLKVGHHGSSTSTTEEFIDATTPDLAVITVGADNEYGHPHRETIEILNNDNITTLRTDINGDIVIYSDGQVLSYVTAA